MLRRLKNAGAEERIHKHQFGFKSKSGTVDAIYLARRILDKAMGGKNGKITLLALDWAKAFDSISPEALCKALHRFGIPNDFIDIIASIYHGRKFVVRDSGITSEKHDQFFGISQGCPLSPFLFIILMTI